MSRRVVVTGGAKGIGRAVVAAFLAQGDEVTALGRDRDALQRLVAAHDDVVGLECDVRDEDAVTATFARLPDVDVLINNAGIGESAPLGTTTLAAWERHFDVNVTGPFLCMRAVVPGMRERGDGAIVTVASVAGRVGVAYTAAYTASKHAVIGLTRAVAAELAGTGVRANAVCPTFVRTEMTARSVANIMQRTGRAHADAEAALAAMSPLGRLLEPEEVADGVVYLASPAAAAINGQSVVIDGGGLQA